jgi:hypothetical protein
MYCPNCSSEASTEQKFCRSCGMELQPVAALIRDQSPLVKPQSAKHQSFEARHRTMWIWAFISMFSGVCVSVSLKILGKEGIRPLAEFTPYVSVIAALAVFFGMALMCYPFLQLALSNTRSRGKILPNPEPTIRLQPALMSEEQSSVTEQTTEFLERVEARVSVRDTAPQSE